MSDLGAFDPLGLARSGMMFVTGAEEPRLIHLGVLDQTTAIALSHAIITALFVRDRRGWDRNCMFPFTALPSGCCTAI